MSWSLVMFGVRGLIQIEEIENGFDQVVFGRLRPCVGISEGNNKGDAFYAEVSW